MEEDLPEELKNFADIEVGGLLRRTREHYRQSLQDIEHALRIRASQIDAIERLEIAVVGIQPGDPEECFRGQLRSPDKSPALAGCP